MNGGALEAPQHFTLVLLDITTECMLHFTLVLFDITTECMLYKESMVGAEYQHMHA